ncbi:hypothetical protein NBRC10513_000936 [Rhodotorula toruloides]
MVADIIRDSTFGQLVNWASKGRYFSYADQRPDYIVRARYFPHASPLPSAESSSTLEARSPTPKSREETLVNAPGTCAELKTLKTDVDVEKQILESVGAQTPTPPAYEYLVEFEENDPDKPMNWSSRKRIFIGFLISLLTFGIYIGSAIYTASIPGLMEEFGINQVGATSGLTLFVAAYGIGPMILSPMQELPRWGRNPVYILGLFAFVIFQIPEILAKNVATVLVFRFLSGFVGSPALATGGATMGDIFPLQHIAIAIGAWSVGAISGPIFGPVIGGFAAERMNWRWPFLELLWISGTVLLIVFLLLPETMESTILIRRAERLRRLTGNPLLRAPAELGHAGEIELAPLLTETIGRAFRLMLEPALAVAHFYLALVYAIFYLWFEAFPLTFNEIHHFSLGLGGLPYLAFVVAAVPTFIGYYFYQTRYMASRMAKNPNLAPEARLELAMIGAVFVPVSLLIFGWTARADVHWIWPTIGAGIYLPGVYYSFQSILMYVSMSYPKYAASNLAGNDFLRSVFASVFPLFGARYYKVLGIGGGCSLLAGVSILMIPLLYAIIRFGDRLRARSHFAE